MASQPAVRFGPATLQDGVRRLHAWGLMYASFVTIISVYAVEGDCGKLTAMCGFLNGLGVVVVAIFLGKLPGLFAVAGATPMAAGSGPGHRSSWSGGSMARWPCSPGASSGGRIWKVSVCCVKRESARFPRPSAGWQASRSG